VGLAGLAVAGFGIGTAFAVSLRGSRSRALALRAGQVLGTSLLVGGSLLSLHGARAERLQLPEGGAVDTLGYHLVFREALAPSPAVRRLRFALSSGRSSADLRPELVGTGATLVGTGATGVRSRPDGGLFDGPVLVPVALRELRSNPHPVTWLRKGEPFDTPGGALTFVGFRQTKDASGLRILADIRVKRGDSTETVSPGMIASAGGSQPFAVTARGLGPIALARIDADGGRVAVLLSSQSRAATTKVALVALRLRPGLPLAWVGAALALVTTLFALGGRARPE